MLVQPALVQQLAKHLTPGAIVYLSSDCFRVARWMRDQFMDCEEEEIEDTSDSRSDGQGDDDNMKTMTMRKRKSFRLVESVQAISTHMTPGAVIVSQAPPGLPNNVPLKGPAPFPAHRLPLQSATKVGTFLRPHCIALHGSLTVLYSQDVRNKAVCDIYMTGNLLTGFMNLEENDYCYCACPGR